MKTFKDLEVGYKMHCIIDEKYCILPINRIQPNTEVYDSDTTHNRNLISLESNEGPIYVFVGFLNESSSSYSDVDGNIYRYYISKKELMAKLSYEKAQTDEKITRYINKSKKLDNLLSQIKES